MNDVLSDDNGNLDIGWYEDVNISLVCIKNESSYEGFSNADVFHKEDINPTIERAFCDDETIQIINILINDVDKIRFYDEPCANMDSSDKCSVTNNFDILQNVLWYDDQHKSTVHMNVLLLFR